MISSDVPVFSAGSYAVAAPDVFSSLGAAAPSLGDDGAWRGSDGAPVPADISARVLSGIGRDASPREAIERLATPLGRRTFQTRDGLAGEVLLPDAAAFSAALVGAAEDPAIEREACSAYNEWIAAFVAADPTRFVGVGRIPSTGLDDALAALAQCQRLGLRGVSMTEPPAGAGTAPGGDALDFWERLDGTVVVIGADFGHATPMPLISAGRPPSAGAFLVRLAFSGVADDVPGLRVFVANAGAGWLPYVLESADTNYQRAAASRRVALAREGDLPSDYVRRFTWCTAHGDRAAVLLRNYLGEAHLAWSAAAPTSDGDWPRDLEMAERLLSGLPAASKQRLLADNCHRLFRIPDERSFAPDFSEQEIGDFVRTALFD